jgi:hypothetical protein
MQHPRPPARKKLKIKNIFFVKMQQKLRALVDNMFYL